MTNLRTVIGSKIKILRKGRQMSQADLAHLIGCEPPLIGRYERGLTLPNIEQLIRIATVFNVAPGELLPGGQDEIRTRLISLRQELSEKIIHVDSPENLEEIIRLTDTFISYKHNPKKRLL
ncbi:helix-turn-helix domain-containing protein [Pseudomonas lundensis]|uniref:helix-turn-helix domain-containing protein n=1 Tax=Pseudomonas lundensis TaxID=86185 RepID=UPI000653DF8C|nr:helix-turn-helix transcriptional regulator [Pseudomonas lundensis]KMM82632.1 XRE family transcriptional regulator [Pseudomonas lundensis]MBM1186403.1 helix-turn-helix transcriptional regulator [Pseudomonas lundensis]NNA05858.1 helix-turn-helix transcriptional regulator [Pseudomonas lundensis]NNA18347.1 helix-turn-helix transcriptional regulator [Pseudomonas lundensis]OZY50595.1 XRE family transcriptional regulator [Pseudomonas lundensis]